MERPPAVPNVVYALRIAAWVLALEGVAEFFANTHWHFLLRRLVGAVTGDAGRPRLPEDWWEWYNS